MANIRKFAPFDAKMETWDSYLVQFDCNLEANYFTNITNNRKRAIVLSNCGREVFEMAHTIITPDPLLTVPWTTLMEKQSQHYAPKPSCIARWHTFYWRDQVEGEFISRYRSALQNRLVSGVRYIRLQKCLLTRATLMLQEALDEAVTTEQSGRSAEKIQT
ncbi:hypothetical protein E2320_003770 [Naja naja]|nr:hypothetical protein E2320_003770 [Naja naja]